MISSKLYLLSGLFLFGVWPLVAFGAGSILFHLCSVGSLFCSLRFVGLTLGYPWSDRFTPCSVTSSSDYVSLRSAVIVRFLASVAPIMALEIALLFISQDLGTKPRSSATPVTASWWIDIHVW